MNNQLLDLNNFGTVELSKQDSQSIDGGGLPLFLLIGGGAAAGFAIYELGKAAGEFLYYITNPKP